MHRIERSNLRLLADDLAEHAARAGVELTTRPWNRFEPDDTDWWLVPGTDWPAYKFGKVFLHWLDRAENRAEAALHLEKGLGVEVSAVYDAPRGRRLIMDPDWAWHLLLQSLEGEEWQSALVKAREQAFGGLTLGVQGSYVADPDSFDPYVYDFERDRVKFDVPEAPGALRPLSAQTPAGLLDGLERVSSLDQLVLELESLTANPWLWLEFMVGVDMRLAVDPIEQPAPSPIGELWLVLETFTPWLRAGPPTG